MLNFTSVMCFLLVSMDCNAFQYNLCGKYADFSRKLGLLMCESNDVNGRRARRSLAVKTGEHTYASWSRSSSQPPVRNIVDDGFFDEDEDEDEDKGQGGEDAPRDSIESLRTAAKELYDSIFFYGLEMGSPEKSRRTPKSKRKSPFLTNSELIGEELLDEPELSLDQLRSERGIQSAGFSRSKAGPIPRLSRGKEGRTQRALPRPTSRPQSRRRADTEPKVSDRLAFLEEEIAYLEEEIVVLDVAVEAADTERDALSYARRRDALQDKLDMLNTEYIGMIQ